MQAIEQVQLELSRLETEYRRCKEDLGIGRGDYKRLHELSTLVSEARQEFQRLQGN